MWCWHITFFPLTSASDVITHAVNFVENWEMIIIVLLRVWIHLDIVNYEF